MNETKVGKPNSIFCTEFKDVFFLSGRVLNDAWLKYEENLYLHYITGVRL